MTPEEALEALEKLKDVAKKVTDLTPHQALTLDKTIKSGEKALESIEDSAVGWGQKTLEDIRQNPHVEKFLRDYLETDRFKYGDPNSARDVAQSLLGGLTYGAGDEISSALKSVLANMQGKRTSVDPSRRGTWKELYNAILPQTRGQMAMFKKYNPGLELGLSLLGETASAVPFAIAATPLAAARSGTVLGRLFRGKYSNIKEPLKPWRLPERVLAGGLAGGALGGLTAFNEGEGGAGQRALGIPQGAAMGSMVGGAIPFAGAVARRPLNLMNRYNLSRQGNSSFHASTIGQIQDLAKQARKADITESGRVRKGPRSLSGQKGKIVADISPSARAWLDMAMRKRLSKDMTEDAYLRVSNAAEQVTKDLYKLLNQSFGGPKAAARAIAKQGFHKKDKIRAAYDTAYEYPIDWTTEAGESLYALLQRPSAARAMADAFKIMRDRGEQFDEVFNWVKADEVDQLASFKRGAKEWEEIEDDLDLQDMIADIGDWASVDELGQTFQKALQAGGKPDTKMIHRVLSGLDRVIRGLEVDPRIMATSEAGQGFKGIERGSIKKLRNEIRDALGEANPHYHRASSMFAKNAEARRAVILGARLASGRFKVDEIAEQYDKLPKQIQRFVRIGFNRQLQHIADTQRGTIASMVTRAGNEATQAHHDTQTYRLFRHAMTSPHIRSVMNKISKSPSASGKLSRELKRLYNVYERNLGISPDLGKQFEDAFPVPAPAQSTRPNAIAQAFNLRFGDAATQVGQAGRRVIEGDQLQNMPDFKAMSLAEALLEPMSPQTAAFLRMLAQKPRAGFVANRQVRDLERALQATLTPQADRMNPVHDVYKLGTNVALPYLLSTVMP